MGERGEGWRAGAHMPGMGLGMFVPVAPRSSVVLVWAAPTGQAIALGVWSSDGWCSRAPYLGFRR